MDLCMWAVVRAVHLMRGLVSRRNLKSVHLVPDRCRSRWMRLAGSHIRCQQCQWWQCGGGELVEDGWVPQQAEHK